MSQILFVSRDQDFLLRMKQEGGTQALTTPSMLQGLHWITNTEIPLAGIYLNPNDTQYSALRFLEISLLQRPATPVFLIDSENEMGANRPLTFLRNLNVKGVFRGHETYQQFLGPLKFEPQATPEEIMQRVTPRNEHKGYIELPIGDLAHLHHYPFDIFIEDGTQNLRLFAAHGSPVEKSYFEELKKKTSWVFVSERTIQEMREKVRDTQGIFMELESFPVAWKTAEVLFNAKMLLRELQQGGLNDGVVEHANLMLGDLLQLVSHLGQAPNLRRLVQLSKESDRGIACTTLAILMCKVLKFEQNSIVEILGIASFFQDVSLYQSPFGNLSSVPLLEMKADAAKYYVQHPLMSADLVAKNTAVPEVTLQVIRQHHERKDRSGFPNKVGGLQLHPMGEILSLINSYLDHGDHFNNVKDEVFSHYSDRITQAFQGLLDLLEAPKKAAI
jgi:hypothetical protein